MNKNKKQNEEQNINQKETGLIKANLQETNLIIPREYNLKNDIIFKAFFSRPGNEIYLIDFLGALLKTNVKNIEVKDEVSIEQLAVEEKGGRLDLQATVNMEMIVNIELQMKNNLNIEERTSFYGAKQMTKETK